MNGEFALCWSQRQNALHIEPVERMLSNNRGAYADDRASDFIPVYIGTKDECHNAADACRGTMASREHYGEPMPVTSPAPAFAGVGTGAAA